MYIFIQLYKYYDQFICNSIILPGFLYLVAIWIGIVVLLYRGANYRRLHDMKKEMIMYDYADLKTPLTAKMYERQGVLIRKK